MHITVEYTATTHHGNPYTAIPFSSHYITLQVASPKQKPLEDLMESTEASSKAPH